MSLTTPSRIIQATAPIRVCDIGGWTDTWFATHGAIFNIAVNPTAQVEIRQTKAVGSPKITIYPQDFELPYVMDLKNQHHPLLESAINRISTPADSDIFIKIHSDAPAGCSTGTSAAVTVALVGALHELNHTPINPLEVAYTAHRVETEDLHQQSGIQDQISAALGGVNFIQMRHYPYDNDVTQLALPNAIWAELEQRLCVVFLGRRHTSSDVHSQVIAHFEQGGGDTQILIEPLRVAARQARDAILAGDFAALGDAANQNTLAQRQLHPDLICPDANAIMTTAKKCGALGAKVNGAGGDGGSITIIASADPQQKNNMINAITVLNPQFSFLPISINRQGLTVKIVHG